jgi:hypothetical protein
MKSAFDANNHRALTLTANSTTLAGMVYAKLGLALLRKAWMNLDLIWVVAPRGDRLLRASDLEDRSTHRVTKRCCIPRWAGLYQALL